MVENPIFSYTKRDYERSRQEGLARIPILSKGQWTDLNATDPGIIILDYVHALVDMMSYYLDHQALESFIVTAKERENIFRLAKQLSYKIRSAQGAECDVTFELLNQPYSYTIKIPKYTEVSTLSGIQYLTKEDAYLQAGSRSITIPCSQGKISQYKYQGTGVSRYSNIVGATNQSIRLVDNNIDIDSITIVEDIGREWKSIDHISFAAENARVFEAELTSDNYVLIKFGDGERGAVPSTEDYLNISYIVTDAEEGKVSENSIVYLKSNISDNDGRYVTFNVNNNNPSVGGSAPQSTQEIRDLAPGILKAQDRAVTLSDFENLAKSVEGVLDAKAYDINRAPDICLHHEVKVVITPKDNKEDMGLLKNKVYNFLYQKMIPPTNLQIMSPSYEDIYVNVTIRKSNITTESRLKYLAEQSIIEYFDNIASNVGESFYPADLLTSLYRLEGFRSLSNIEIYTMSNDGRKTVIPTEREYYISEFSSFRLSQASDGLIVNVVE